MDLIVRAIATVLDFVLTAYFWIVIISALLSWVNPDPYNPIVRFLRGVTEPVFYKIRSWIPFAVVGRFRSFSHRRAARHQGVRDRGGGQSDAPGLFHRLGRAHVVPQEGAHVSFQDRLAQQAVFPFHVRLLPHGGRPVHAGIGRSRWGRGRCAKGYAEENQASGNDAEGISSARRDLARHPGVHAEDGGRPQGDGSKEAQIILDEARAKADATVQKGHSRLAQVHEEIEALKRTRTQFEIQLKGLLNSHLEMLEASSPERDKVEEMESKLKYLKKVD